MNVIPNDALLRIYIAGCSLFFKDFVAPAESFFFIYINMFVLMVEKVSLSCQCCSGSNLPKSASVHRNPIQTPHNLQLGLGTVPKFLLRQFRYLGFDSSSRMILF